MTVGYVGRIEEEGGHCDHGTLWGGFIDHSYDINTGPFVETAVRVSGVVKESSRFILASDNNSHCLSVIA